MPEFDEALVERLAKAIHHEQYPLARERDEFWETERHQDMYFDFAKAALTALSETHVIVSKVEYEALDALTKPAFDILMAVLDTTDDEAQCDALAEALTRVALARSEGGVPS